MERPHAHLRAYLEAVGGLPGGRFVEDAGLAWCVTGIPWPMFNGALALPSRGACDGAAAVAAGLEAAAAPWFWWVLPDTPDTAIEAAELAGAVEFDSKAPWMEARIADLDEPVLPAGVTIEEVRDEQGQRLWAATVREVYGFPQLGEHAWVMPAERCGFDALPWRQWTAFLDGEPVGVTLLFCGGGVAGLFGLGTKAAARRRGIGRLLTLLPLKQSGEQIAGFFSTEEGNPLYRSLGFATNGYVSRWLGGAEALR
jgi:hypothetical protein